MDLIDLKAHNIDVWLQNLTGHTMSRFTFLPAEETNAAWSRDGSMIAFRSGGRRRLSIKPAVGLGEEKQILDTTHNGDPIPTGWALDGKQILITSQDPKGGSDLELVSVDGKVTPLLNSPASETNGQISPDGKWMIYASDESGDWQVYATSFPNPGGKVQISRDEGSEPRWRPDGKEIFYIGPHRMLMVTSFNTEGTLSTGVPQPLFRLRGRAPISSTDLFTYDVTKDGKRFLVNRYMKPTDVPPINIILNSTSH
jgi:Tol biopolymer transport system component